MKQNGRTWLRIAALLLAAITLFGQALADASKLRYGDRGDAVLQLQTALKALGYKIGTPDGKYGAYTENAVRAFQRKHGLNVDGIAGAKTQEAIYAAVSGSTATGSSSATATTPAASGSGYFGGNYATLEQGHRGERVKLLQQALKGFGYQIGTVDGSFGASTYTAVKEFQRGAGLTADGKAGKRTLQAIEWVFEHSGQSSSTSTAGASSTATSTGSAADGILTQTLRAGMSGSEVRILQTRLKALGWYGGKVDGDYGLGTAAAVSSFQKAAKLTADGIAGAKTLKKLFDASAPTAVTATAVTTAVTASAPTSTSTSTSTTVTTTAVSAPEVGQVLLLHWFNQVKPSIRSGQRILVYDPATGISWTLRLYSLGRHADAEPLTAADTAAMMRAFGNTNTWNQKAVYVQLPSGVWTLASTHDMPHLTGSIKDNNFNGHLCVHFLRDMAECEKNDPKYGVANQKTIRAAWKKLTGEDIP